MNSFVDPRHRVLGGDAVQLHREGDVEDIRHHRAEALLVGLDLAGQRHAHEGPAVEAAAKGDDGVAARGDAGDLDRVLAGLGARGDEDRLLREIARHRVVQALGQADVVLVGQHLMAGVGEAWSSASATAAMTLGWQCPVFTTAMPGGKVDVAVALDVPDLGVQRAIGVDLGHHPHPARNGFVAALGYFGVQHVWLHHGHARSLRGAGVCDRHI